MPPPGDFRATPEDLVLLGMLAAGDDDAVIGRVLGGRVPLTTGAVRLRVRALRARMGARSRTHMTALAVRWRLID